MKGRFILSLIVVSLLMPLPSLARVLCVNVTKANLRVGPGADYEVGWQVNKYMPFVQVAISFSGDWYAVEDVDKTVLWIKKELVTDKYRCTVVTTPDVNIRTGPGTHHPMSALGAADQYDSFKVEKSQGDWIKVRAEDNRSGWIRGDFLWMP